MSTATLNKSVFERLYKSRPQPGMMPEENFFTESLAYALNLDSKWCERFVQFVAGDKKDYAAPFTINTQVRYSNSIVDLVITDVHGKNILVEIKIKARENKYLSDDGQSSYGQITKYLRTDKGDVAFIAQDAEDVKLSEEPDHYLGQFEWKQIYNLLKEFLAAEDKNLLSVNRHVLGEFFNFMNFMNMRPFENFSEQDIYLASTNFLDLYDKLLEFLSDTRKDAAIKNYCKKYHWDIPAKASFTPSDKVFTLRFYNKDGSKVKYSVEYGFVYVNKNPNYQDGLYFYLQIYVVPKEAMETIKQNLGRISLSDKYFPKAEILADGHRVVYFETYFVDLMKSLDYDTKRLSNHIFGMLAELEDKGVFKAVSEANK